MEVMGRVGVGICWHFDESKGQKYIWGVWTYKSSLVSAVFGRVHVTLAQHYTCFTSSPTV